jgi:membrane-associated phospholipid phosphatase
MAYLAGHCARVVSNVANPLFVALPFFLFISFYTSSDVLHALLWWVIAVGGISVAPLLFIQQGVRKGKLSDHHVSVREQRFFPLLFGLGCMVISFVLLYSLKAPRVLVATVVAVVAAIFISLLITQVGKWKISLHLVGIAGAVTVCVLLWGPFMLLLSPLVILVGWARWQVHAHTLPQAIAGTMLAIVVTLGAFGLFRII